MNPSPLETRLNELIEKKSKDFCVNDSWFVKECGYDRDRRHFQAGCAYMMPILLRAIEQRDSLRMDCPGYDLSEPDNKELLHLLGGGKDD